MMAGQCGRCVENNVVWLEPRVFPEKEQGIGWRDGRL